MNLQQLIESGALLGSSAHDFVKKSVTWEGNTFDVFIKRDMSAADFEYVLKDVGDDDSRMARRVHRFVSLDNGERIPYETALQFKTGLLIALANAINSVQKPLTAESNQVKKNSRRKKSSGTN